MSRVVLHARWLLPISSPPIENGCIVVENGRIAAVERAGRPQPPTADFGDAVILPGFVNAHTHLQLTFCHGRVPYQGSFAQWIKDLAALWRGDEGTDETLARSVRTGIHQSLAAGVTAVADVGNGRPAMDAWAQSPIHTLGLLEVLGMGAKHRRQVADDRSVDAAANLCREAGAPCRDAVRAEVVGSLHLVGISPHAPYTAEAAVYRDAIAFAARTRRPICTHLAETRDEERFLREGTGALRRLLEDFDLWDGSFVPPGCGPVEYAHQLGLLTCEALLAHVNYATDADLDLIAAGSASVVYCPRSHRFFEHEPHRYRDMLERGINVCIGTDSLASNDSLSILDELRFLRARDEVSRSEHLLALATLAGARALKLETEIGSLEPGKRADLVVVPLANPRTRHPADDVLTGVLGPAAVYVGGKRMDPI